MENYDRGRRQSSDDDRSQGYRSRPGYEDRGGEREWSRETERPRRAERGWLDYDRDSGRFDERRGGREESRYAEGGGAERPSFSPDWSREGTEPMYSDDPYYSRNRERGSDDDWRRARSESRRGGDDERRWEQRARASIPREQRELAERSRPGDYYDPNWPYERAGRGRELERSRNEDRQSRYRGYYSRSTTPFSYPGGSGYLYSESWALQGPYTGRGPKGYKRSDEQIVEEACQRLERDGEIDASDIEVSAEGGVIRLRGTVRDRQTKRRAEDCVDSIYGTRDVMNELRVAQQGEQSQGSQAPAGSQTATPGMRPGSSTTSEPFGDDERTPRH